MIIVYRSYHGGTLQFVFIIYLHTIFHSLIQKKHLQTDLYWLSCQQECQLDTIHQMQCSEIGGLHLGQLFHQSVGYTNLASCWLLPHCHAIPYGAPAGRSCLPMVCCSDGNAGVVVAWSSPNKVVGPPIRILRISHVLGQIHH